MNIRAMMGAEIMTDWPMVRDAPRHSPARIATYSKPESAPTVICPKMARLNRLGRGGCQGNGSKCEIDPRHNAHTGSAKRMA